VAFADRLVLESNPAVQACRRTRLPADYLYVQRSAVAVSSTGPLIMRRPWREGEAAMACALLLGVISLAKFFPPDGKMTNLSRLGHDQVVGDWLSAYPHNAH